MKTSQIKTVLNKLFYRDLSVLVGGC